MAAPQSPAVNGSPPAQSRDGSAPSRYFAPNNVYPAFGNVLVPNSSPIAPSHSHNAHNTSGNAADVAVAQQGAHPRPPSSIISATSPPSIERSSSDGAGQRRPRDTSAAGDVGDEPPRKRINRGPVDDALGASSPESPAIRGPGNRRRMAPPGSPSSSEESLVDPVKVLSNAASHPHAPAPAPPSTTTPAPTPAASASTPSPAEAAYTRFKITQPLHPEPLVRAAWIQSKEDVRAASNMLNDQVWIDRQSRPAQPRPQPAASKPTSVAVSNKANKKSAIYAHRPAVPTPAPLAMAASTSASSVKSTPKATPKAAAAVEVPPSPAVAPPRKRKMVIEDSDESDFDDSDSDVEESVDEAEIRALSFFNSASVDVLQEMTGKLLFAPHHPHMLTSDIGCTPVQADKIAELRPFDTVDDLTTKLNQGARRAGPAGLSPKVFSDTVAVYQGYGSFDTVLDSIDSLGAKLKAVINSWALKGDGDAANAEAQDDGALNLQTFDAANAKDEHFIAKQPSLVSDEIVLKDYQLLGINWLNLMHRKGHGCILADEMGMHSVPYIPTLYLPYFRSRQDLSGHQLPRSPEGEGEHRPASHHRAVLDARELVQRVRSVCPFHQVGHLLRRPEDAREVAHGLA